MTYVFQAVWPIVDDSRTRAELIVEATDKLAGLAEQAHAVITGPAVWEVADAADVPGWQGYAPRLVLIGTFPAEHHPVRIGPAIDEARVLRGVRDGSTELSRAERLEVVRRLLASGYRASAIAKHLNVSGATARGLIDAVALLAAA